MIGNHHLNTLKQRLHYFTNYADSIDDLKGPPHKGFLIFHLITCHSVTLRRTMYPSDNSTNASTVSSKRTRSPEPHDRVLRPRKRVRSDTTAVERNVVRPSRKRRKVPLRFKGVRGVFAYLARLLTVMPDELVYLEIFAYLEPRDLLALSRSCKRMRKILFSRSKMMDDIWRIARRNVEGNLPPLPRDLNEPQYAHLLFDTECEFCDKSSRHNLVLWKFRVRCCRDCLTTFRIFNWLDLLYELRPFVSFEILIKEKIQGKDQDDIIFDFKKASRLRAEFMALESDEARQTWIIRKREERTEIVDHAFLCEAWAEAQTERHNARLTSLRTERLEAILSRLDMIGLRQEAELILEGRSNLNYPEEFAGLPCVKKPVELNNRSWAHIKAKLTEMLTDHRRRRLAQKDYTDLRKEYHLILSCQDLRDIYPGLGDILTDPVIEASVWDTERNEVSTPSSLRSLLLQYLERCLNQWRLSKTEELLVVLRKARPCAVREDLYLATTVFGCARCTALLVYPQVFYHRCCYRNRAANDQTHDRMRALNAHYDTDDQEGPWSSCSLFFHSQSSRFAHTIVIGAGLNPSTATVEDLTLSQPVIECMSDEADFFPERLFLTWPAALTYNLTVNDEKSFVIHCFGEESARVRAREPLSMFLKTVCCAHCHMESTPKDFTRHLLSVHDLNFRSIDSAGFYRLHGNHWYWNPRSNLGSIGMDFRW
ncbi:hypothetical protein EV360DRAFT_88444 [Lentinula raphanica]|nr:hypothetical protein EV360DRAFT_88444 [Lentinula raphanica]